MRMHPLVTVKKAASLLGVEKSAIREKLVAGEMKGEIRRIGNKDKWFVYSGELDFLLESQRIPELEARAERVSLEGLNTFFEKEEDSSSEENDATIIEEIDQPSSIPSAGLPVRATSSTAGMQMLPFEQIMDVISRQFSLRLAEEHARSQELKELLAEQQSLVATIPSLKEQLDSQLKINEELKDGLNALRSEMEKLKPTPRKNWFSKIFG